MTALSVHLLSNGRRSADSDFTRRYAAVGLSDIMAGIPVYAPEPGLHDFIVQAAGAFTETVHGILNLASLGQAVEIRVVVQRHTVPVLAGLAAFIARNLPFVAQVALMGLEMTGLARPNSPLVWADPADYQRELAEAAGILTTTGITTRIYNHRLCALDRCLWPYGPRRMRRRLHDKRQPPQPAPAPGNATNLPWQARRPPACRANTRN